MFRLEGEASPGVCWKMMSHGVGGSFNPFETYESNWIISPGGGEHKKTFWNDHLVNQDLESIFSHLFCTAAAPKPFAPQGVRAKSVLFDVATSLAKFSSVLKDWKHTKHRQPIWLHGPRCIPRCFWGGDGWWWYANREWTFCRRWAGYNYIYMVPYIRIYMCIYILIRKIYMCNLYTWPSTLTES